MSEWSKPDAWYQISGRGWVACYDLRPRRKAGELRAMHGQIVEVEGENLAIKGVETFAVGDEQSVGDVGFLFEHRPLPGRALVESSITAFDIEAYVEKRLDDPEFVRAYIKAHKEEIAALTRQLESRPTIEEWSAEIDRVRDHWKGKVAKLEREIVETLDPLAAHERSGHLRTMGSDELFSFTLPVKDWLRMISLDLRLSRVTTPSS